MSPNCSNAERHMFAAATAEWGELADQVNKISKICFYIKLLEGCTGFGLNVFLLVVSVLCLRYKLVSWKRYSFVVSNTTADTVACCILLLSSLFYKMAADGEILPDYLKEITDSLCAVAVYAPAINYVTICIIQFVAVWKPLEYYTKLSKGKVGAIIGINWITLAVAVGVFVFGDVSISRLEQNHNYKQTNRLLKFNIGFRLLFLISFTIGVAGTYSAILVRLRNRPSSHSRSHRFVKRLGLNVLLYLVTACTLCASEIVTAYYSAVFLQSIKPKQKKSLCYRAAMLFYSSIKTKRSFLVTLIVTPIWLSRLIFDPVLHLFKDGMLRKLLRQCHLNETSRFHSRTADLRGDFTTSSIRSYVRTAAGSVTRNSLAY